MTFIMIKVMGIKKPNIEKYSVLKKY